MIDWKKVKWPYNSDAPYCNWECWKASIKGRKVILHPGMWPDKGWSYVVQGGYSGFLPGITDLDLAKKELERRFSS